MEEIEKAAEEAQDIIDKNAAGDPQIKKMMDIVHKFVQTEKVMCYGGTAINNVLPEKKRFYDPKVDIPDYDFFSENPQKLCVKLSDQLKKAGLENIEAKPGAHLGTFKVFCDYIGVADITHMESDLFKRLWKDSIIKDNIHYVPPDFLKMNVYLELSRPMGDVSRWKKVFGRLTLLNDEYPTVCPKSYENLNDTLMKSEIKKKIENLLIEQKVVLLGFNAGSLQQDHQEWKIPMDILVEEKDVQRITQELIKIFGRGSARARSYEEYEELLPAHTDIVEGSHLLVRIYETMACHSYHELKSGLRIGSIPTLINFFFAMLYADKEFTEHTTRQRVICAAQRLVDMANNKKERRFELLTPITCLGHQKDLIDMKKEKSLLYEKASKNREGKLFKKFFFSYKP
jgi:hypothetical protein